MLYVSSSSLLTYEHLRIDYYWSLPLSMWDRVSICGTPEKSWKCGTVPRKGGHLVTHLVAHILHSPIDAKFCILCHITLYYLPLLVVQTLMCG